MLSHTPGTIKDSQDGGDNMSLHTHNQQLFEQGRPGRDLRVLWHVSVCFLLYGKIVCVTSQLNPGAQAQHRQVYQSKTIKDKKEAWVHP